ncbi:MAG: right-handed parallel beta-helix repeat-containing protein [Phycisphaerales bacterium]
MSNELDRRFLLGGFAGVAGASALAAMAKGGPLDPPAGAVGPSGSTLQQLSDKIARSDSGVAEPRIPVTSTTCPGDLRGVYVITQPGSYYLIENLSGVAGKPCIYITAANVVLDMMGFAISGGSDGIVYIGSEGFTLRNGLIHNLTGSAVNAASLLTNAGPSWIENLRIKFCTGSGLLITGGSIVRNCVIRNCGGTGISTGQQCLIEGCTISLCDAQGIALTGANSVVRGCNLINCLAPGVSISSVWCTIVGNVLSACGSSSGSTRAAIRCAGSINYIAENRLYNNPFGIECTAGGNIVVSNTVAGSTSAFELAAGNLYGPIVAPSGATPAVSGGAAASTMASVDPRANFVF